MRWILTFFTHMLLQERRSTLLSPSLMMMVWLSQTINELCNVKKSYFNLVKILEIVNHVPLTPPFLLFSIDEFRDALFQMDYNKSPSPDGLNPAFYKNKLEPLWFRYFLSSNLSLKMALFPHKLIKLQLSSLPRFLTPIPWKDFKPISMCSVLYKIISKTLANHLKPLLQKCISLEQSAFVSLNHFSKNAYP